MELLGGGAGDAQYRRNTKYRFGRLSPVTLENGK
jgi:hypothetical protein